METYNVICMLCGLVFTPAVGSSLWWQAKKRFQAGYLDALPVTGDKCGCIRHHHSEAPFRVFGYDMTCDDYNFPCNTFTQAIRIYRERVRQGDVVFITGVSTAVIRAICKS